MSSQSRPIARDDAPAPTGFPELPNGPLSIDVISDVVCPWCYIGKRQLETALTQWRAAHPDSATPVVRWHPFQLNPDLPVDGVPREQYLRAKFGSSDTGAIYDRVRQAAGAVGLALDLDSIARQPNTVRAHALISFAQDSEQDTLVERLFEAYFIQGCDLTQEDVLIGVARAGGLPEPLIEAAITDDSVHETIRTADAHARELGVQGVPFFIFNRQLAVSGAAGADTLLRAMERALEGPANEAGEDSEADDE